MAKKSSGLQFLGLSLSGGKSNRSAMAVIEYFPDKEKVFLKTLHEKIQSDKIKSSDVKICEFLDKYKSTAGSCTVDVPLKLPKCIRCRLSCPGYEKCREPEIIWLWKKYRQNKKKTKKLFTPYTERCVETLFTQDLEEPFYKDHALGANLAPVVARALYLQKQIQMPLYECFPQLTLWRIGRSLGISKVQLRRHKHAVEGVYVRSLILEAFSKKNISFFYGQEVHAMTMHLESDRKSVV